MATRWLEWSRALEFLAQTGRAYANNVFDRQRYEQVSAIAAEMLAAHTKEQPEVLVGLFADQQGYATPKVDTRGGIIQDGRILLVRENLDEGRWTLPGGWADMGDSPSRAIEREIFEESGFVARAVKLAAIYDRDLHGHLPNYFYATYKLFFLCEITGGGPAAPNEETSEVAFFPEDALPELSISRVTPEEIHMLFRHHRQPDLPTEFD